MSSKATVTPMLDSMINIMEAVVKESLPFNMNSFYADEPESIPSDIHNCGTAACIVGYCVADDDFLSKFLPHPIVKGLPTSDVCCEICHALDAEIGASLSESIYEYSAIVRSESLQSIEASNSNHELLYGLTTHTHVGNDDDCPTAALDYMKRVREYVQTKGKSCITPH